ncbi:hypothetical protein LTR27_005598 [Elasticomyces elasticus]|nr:hypothetical protein LTR27_005598 [Elasticomyces elasticus]
MLNLTAREIEIMVGAMKSTDEPFKPDYKTMAELLGLKNAASATAAWCSPKKEEDDGRHNSSTNARSKSESQRKTNTNDTIDASPPPKKSSRLDDNFTRDESAEPDNEEVSIDGLKKEDVGNEDDVMEALLAGEPSGMEMVSEDVEEGATKAEEEDEEDEAGMGLEGSVGGGSKVTALTIKKEHIKIENEELVGVNESVDVQRGDDLKSKNTGDQDIAGSSIEDSKA